ncbi:MAG: helix-turn-helix transcriptional regulator [Steroidobacteraceae bacterium]
MNTDTITKTTPTQAVRMTSHAQPGDSRRALEPSLGVFLRAQRERLRPEQFQFPSGRRRAPGLRREEAAQLCGISVTWYTWIEQGRAKAISHQTLHAIARGLRFSRAERAYLFELSGRADPLSRPEPPDPRPLLALVRAVRAPAYVIDRHWDAVAWNRPAAQLFIDWLGRRRERNLLRYVFLDARAPQFILQWPERAERLVAEYRADTAGREDDPVHLELVRTLAQASAVFAAAWRSQQVLAREGGIRNFQHPQRGRCQYEQYTVRPVLDPALKLTVLVPQP